jgi:hypothetical protein
MTDMIEFMVLSTPLAVLVHGIKKKKKEKKKPTSTYAVEGT